jgi:hypothetical protein
MVSRVMRACFVLGRVAAACTSGLELGFNATANHFDRLACLPAGPDSGLWCRTPKLTGRWRQSELSGKEYHANHYLYVTLPVEIEEVITGL